MAISRKTAGCMVEAEDHASVENVSDVCSVSGSEVYCGWENGRRVGQKNRDCNENSWGNGRKCWEIKEELESKDASVLQWWCQ